MNHNKETKKGDGCGESNSTVQQVINSQSIESKEQQITIYFMFNETQFFNFNMNLISIMEIDRRFACVAHTLDIIHHTNGHTPGVPVKMTVPGRRVVS